MKSPLFVAALALLSPLAAAENFDKKGPHAVGWQDVEFFLPGGKKIDGRFYYPALEAGEATEPDRASGPYPVVAHGHGNLGLPEDYDDLCNRVASWGFVVSSVGEGENANLLSGKQKHLLAHVDENNLVEGHYLYQMTTDAYPKAVMGHSNGGMQAQFLIKKVPAVRVVVALTPGYEKNNGADDNLREFTGSVLVVAGGGDVVTPNDPAEYYDNVHSARRAAYVEVAGMSHGGSTDVSDPTWGAGIGHKKEQDWVQTLTVNFLMSEVKGVEDAWLGVVGSALELKEAEAERETKSPLPALWVSPSPIEEDTLTLGLSGAPGDQAFLLISPRPGDALTPFGVFGLSLATMVPLFEGALDGSGWLEVETALPNPFGSAALYVQGLTIGPDRSLLTRAVKYQAGT